MKISSMHLAAAILAVGLAFGASQAYAQGGFVPDGQQGRTPQAAPGQSAQAQQFFNETGARLLNLQQALNDKQDQLDQLMASPNPDTAAIRRLTREIGDLQGQALSLQAEARARFGQTGNPNWQGNWGCPWGDCWNGGYRHHGGRHGGHGWRGCWNGYGPGMGMGMMGW